MIIFGKEITSNLELQNTCYYYLAESLCKASSDLEFKLDLANVTFFKNFALYV